MFSTQSGNGIPICQYFDIISLFAAELEEPTTGVLDKGLTLKYDRVKIGFFAEVFFPILFFSNLRKGETLVYSPFRYRMT